MKKSVDYSLDDHPAGDSERLPASWSVAAADDCDECGDVRIELTLEEAGRAGAGVVAGLRKKKIEVTAHDSLKTAPRGYPKDHPRIDLLRQKGLITWKSWPVGAWLGTAQAKKRVVEFLHTSKPINDWLAANVG